MMFNHSTFLSKGVSHCGYELTILKLPYMYTIVQQISKGWQNLVGPKSLNMDQ